MMMRRADPPARLGQTQPGPRASLAIDNLRALVILLVVAFHSVLAYLAFLPPRPFAFDSAPFLWRAFPIVDHVRFIGFDLFCAWLDVFLMSFFFMLSGLFTWPSLGRKGAATFLHGRLLRLGVPFALVVLLLMPPTLYPTYLQSAADPGVAAYWQHWRVLPFWPSGPMWFLWLLLAGDIIAAALYAVLGRRRELVLLLSNWAWQHPARFLAVFLLISAAAYLPPALAFGPSDWGQWGPFAWQLSRPLHYAVYFLAGVAIGACGIERGLLSASGKLPRRWGGWGVMALASFALWIGLTALARGYGAGVPFGLQILDDLSFVVTCFASCLFVFAAALRLAQWQWRPFDALKRNAYGIYLVHYLFVVWLQYALLTAPLPAVVRAAVVFAAALLLSWAASAALGHVPALAALLDGGAARRRQALPSPRGSGGYEGLAD